MSVDIGILISAVSVTLALAGFFIGRVTAAKKAGAEDATALTSITKDIAYIQKDLSGIRDAVERSQKSTDESIRRLHDRIDEHVKEYHSRASNQK